MSQHGHNVVTKALVPVYVDPGHEPSFVGYAEFERTGNTVTVTMDIDVAGTKLQELMREGLSYISFAPMAARPAMPTNKKGN